MRKHSLEEAINIGNQVTGITSALITAAVVFAIGVVLVKVFWAWTVPDLFPGAVEQGLIVADLTWLAAIRTVVLVAIVSSSASLVFGRWGRSIGQM